MSYTSNQKVIRLKTIILVFAFICAKVYAAPDDKVSQYRIYDEVLGITSVMEDIDDFYSLPYPKSDVSSYGYISKKQALSEYQKMSQKGDLYALTALGVCYYSGYGTDKDINKALQYYSEADDKGYIPAAYMLSRHYIDECNYDTAWVYLDKIKNTSYIPLVKLLGYVYEKGWGVECDEEKSFEYYRKATSLGNADSYYNIALYYYRTGNKLKYAESLLQGADKESLDCYRELFQNCYNGKTGVYPDIEKSQKYLTLYYQKNTEKLTLQRNRSKKLIPYLTSLADKGDMYAAYDLSQIYSIYDNVYPSLDKYVKYTLISAKKGISASYKEAAFLYYYGILVKQDLKQALDFYYKAEEYDNVKYIAISALGAADYVDYMCCENDLPYGYDSNGYNDYSTVTDKEALNYIQKLYALDNNDKTINYALAYCYAEGIATSKDLSKASFYGYSAEQAGNYRKLTNKDMSSMYSKRREESLQEIQRLTSLIQENSAVGSDYLDLADLLLDTDFTSENIPKIFDYYKKAALTGESDSFYKIAQFLRYGYSGECRPEEAINYYIKDSVINNTEESLINLFYMYSHAIGCEFDMDKALAYLYLYVSQGGTEYRELLYATTYYPYLQESESDTDSSVEEYYDDEESEESENTPINWEEFGELMIINKEDLSLYDYIPQWYDYTDVIASFLSHYIAQDSSWEMYISDDSFIHNIDDSVSKEDLVSDLTQEYEYQFSSLREYSDYNFYLLLDFYQEDENSSMTAIPLGLRTVTEEKENDYILYLLMYKDTDGYYSILQIKHE